MSVDSIEQLYKNYAVLDEAKDTITEHEKEFNEILAAVKGDEKEKRLASQFIAKFCKHFPKLFEQSLEAQFDLCEDDDVAIRKQAIKVLPSLCQDNKAFTQRITDILGQLLQTDDSTELVVVNNSLLAILKIDPKAALSAIFSLIQNDSASDAIRERCIQFVTTKVKQLGREVINKECEDLIIAESKKVLQDITADEFENIMELLAWTRLGKTLPGRKELIGLVATQALADGEWIPTEQECVDRIMQCVTHALPYFSSQLESTLFVNYFCEHVIPKLEQVTLGEGDVGDPKLELLKLFAELTNHCGTLENPESKIDSAYNCLMSYLPEPPLEPEGDTKGANGEPGITATPSLQFSHTECALFALHALCKKAPSVLAADSNKLKVLRQRLQYTARLTQGYIKKLKEATVGKTPSELKSEENKIKVVALQTTSNINTLIKDLFHTPPSFKSTVNLSFETKHAEKIYEKPIPKEAPRSKSPAAQKRHKPITFDSGDRGTSPEKKLRTDRSNFKVYTPPSGKYSNKISGNSAGFSRGGRFRGGGGRRDFRNGSRSNGYRRRY